MKTYDAMFILPSDLDQPDTDKLLEAIQSEIERQEGSLLETDVLGRRAFARPMHKTHEGNFVRMRFDVDPLKVTALTNRLKLNTQIFRTQILVSDGKPFKVEDAPKADEAAASERKAAAPAGAPSDG